MLDADLRPRVLATSCQDLDDRPENEHRHVVAAAAGERVVHQVPGTPAPRR